MFHTPYGHHNYTTSTDAIEDIHIFKEMIKSDFIGLRINI